MKSFKTELKLNNCQKNMMAKHACRTAYNWGFATCIEAHKNNRKRPTAIDLHKRLVAEVKAANPWYYEVSKSAPRCAKNQQALRDAGLGFRESLYHSG
ncbi:MAG: helix-turn-helix domain-containing protein [Hormoscilla sp. GUM202]|nr:helix-turn-helix domain-containing protein [Hormoscilla sp. GUM202]